MRMMLLTDAGLCFFVLTVISSVRPLNEHEDNRKVKSRGLLPGLLGGNPSSAAPGNGGLLSSLSGGSPSAVTPGSGGILGGLTNLLGSGPTSLLGGPGGPFGVLDGVPRYDPITSTAGPRPAQVPGDAPWTQAEVAYRKMITCPMGISGDRGIVLLVPPTGLNGAETWSKLPYTQQLPRYGFGVCWVDNPTQSTGDIQLTAEFVAYAIKYLAMQSGRPLSVVTYSQGGLNMSWVLTFWLSLRRMVRNLITIASPWRGSATGDVACGVLSLAGGCLPALLQQSSMSRAMRALNAPVPGSGAYAAVPTTSIYTLNDEIVTPQTGPMPASAQPGAVNIALQEVCGRAHVADHFTIVADPATFAIALNALLSGRPANPTGIDRSSCGLLGNLGSQVGSLASDLRAAYASLIGNTSDRIGSILKTATTLRVPAEPPLQLYVCQRGFATGCTGSGFGADSQATAPLLSNLPQAIQGAGPLLSGIL